MTTRRTRPRSDALPWVDRYAPGSPELDAYFENPDLDFDDPDVRRIMAVQRSISGRRAASKRAMKRYMDDRAAEATADVMPVNVVTGEIVDASDPNDDPMTYREGKVLVPLPPGMTREDVPPPACANDFAQVCRGLYSAARRELERSRFPDGAQLMFCDLVIGADPYTGTIAFTAASYAREHGLNRKTVWGWVRRLAEANLIETTQVNGSSQGWAVILRYDEMVRLDVKQRVAAGARKLQRRTFRETTIREVIEDYA